ncbi:hypothetical protein PENTCL1PPCAC_17547, partial [Pristionchus entomophagus]
SHFLPPLIPPSLPMIYRLLLLFSLIGLTLSCAPNAPIHPNLDPKNNQENQSSDSSVPANSPIEGSGESIEETPSSVTETAVEETTHNEPELLKEGPAPHQVITQLSQEFRESMKDWAGIVDKLGAAAQNLMRANGVQNTAPEDEEFFRTQAASHFVQRVRSFV